MTFEMDETTREIAEANRTIMELLLMVEANIEHYEEEGSDLLVDRFRFVKSFLTQAGIEIARDKFAKRNTTSQE